MLLYPLWLFYDGRPLFSTSYAIVLVTPFHLSFRSKRYVLREINMQTQSLGNQAPGSKER